jgi:hypothetical protein
MRNVTKTIKFKGVLSVADSFLLKVIQKVINLTKPVKVKGVFVSRGQFSP